MVCVECYVVQSCFLLRNNLLCTDRVIFIHIQVKNMNLAIHRDSSKYCAWVRSPCYIPNLRIQIKHEKSFAESQINIMSETARPSQNGFQSSYLYHIVIQNLLPLMIPNFDHPLCWTGQEYRWNIRIPSYIIYWCIMSIVCLEKFWAVLGCTFVDDTQISSY